MDGLNDAVNHVFISLYNKGLIYQGEFANHSRDPQNCTVEHRSRILDVQGAMYHFRYVIEDGSDSITIATTLDLETMFGDTALMVHPDDKTIEWRNLLVNECLISGTKTLISGDY